MRRLRSARTALALLVALGLVGIVGIALTDIDVRSEPQAKPAVTVVGSAMKIRPADSPSGRRGASMVAARNEFESFQVVIEAGSTPLRQVTVSLAEPLARGEVVIPPRNVTIYREGYYVAEQKSSDDGAAGPWPDPLIPVIDHFHGESRNAFPVDVPARENRVAWIDVLVPDDAPPGRYTGALLVNAEALRVRVPIRLTVLDFGLPSTSTLRSSFGLFYTACLSALAGGSCASGPAEEEWRLRALFAQAALDNRISISAPYAGSPTSDSAKRLFERYTVPLVDGTAETRLAGARLTSIQIEDRFIASWQAEAGARGFGDRAFLYACDEPSTDPAAWSDCERVAAGAGDVWPDLPVLVTGTVQDASRFGALEFVDILAPVVNQIQDKPGASEYAGDQRPAYDDFLRRRGTQLWLYTSCESHGCGSLPSGTYFSGWPSYVIDAPASEARAMGWLAYRYAADGELYYAVDRSLATAWLDQLAFGGNGDGTLFYLGTPDRIGGTQSIPVESLRLKLIRDGYEDYEYLRFLERQGQGAGALEVAKSLFPTAFAAERGDEEIQLARLRLARLISAAIGGPTP